MEFYIAPKFWLNDNARFGAIMFLIV